MNQQNYSARIPSGGAKPVAAPQSPTDPLLCQKLQTIVFRIGIYAHSRDPELGRLESDFRELAKTFPEPVRPGTVELRTGIPAGDICSAHAKITGILRKIEANRAEDAGECNNVEITLRQVKECVRCLNDILSRNRKASVAMSTVSAQGELSLPQVRRRASAA